MPRKFLKYKKLPRVRLIKRQQMWTLTLQGWGILIATTALLVFFTFTHLYPFLSVTSPVKAEALVVEGWISDEGIKQAVTELNKSSYSKIFTTGGKFTRAFYLVEYKSMAEIAAATLQKLGVPEEKIVVLPTPDVIKDRTRASAVRLRQWLSDSNYPLESLNLFTSDAHARRSWLIYQKILAPKIKVGVIAATNSNYDSKKWWASSEGVRIVLSETIAYVYALIAN
ncbi:YdcF family protein [Iningainema tapete]|uniref:YdcF family protein n=1 Tax=Iningainema tapete BLCC-T55 TaxID=2748662 RepID=A0A8J6XDH3_9CYAN|nr:YdcF family protein [Iningainema tapete]MBD2773274.1 YdcF family protein [Iningainema tapete BLCC-T55]